MRSVVSPGPVKNSNRSSLQINHILILILFLALTLGGVASGARASQSTSPVTLTSGMKILKNAKVERRTYRLTNTDRYAVLITGRDFTVDFNGATLSGDGKGIGVLISNASNVTLKNANIRHCLRGVSIERSRGVVLLNCKTSENKDLPPGTVIDESGTQPEDQWGGGILVKESQNCSVEKCVSQYQWDGIDVISSSSCVIENSDFSYNGNWGVHLWNASKNTFKNNRAIWCTTGSGKLFQALTGWQTYDSQAVGIDHNSNENLIEGNDLRFGGDGIFIRANEGPITPGTVVPPKNGSHRNILRNNDCSFSPNNAIEVDLVDDTIIEGNNCSNSNYGMWLGYSRRCIVRNNLCINDSRHAVEIENGQDDVFERNIFGYESESEKSDGQLVYLRQNGRDATPSRGYRFKNNLFYGAGTGVLLKDTTLAIEDSSFVTAARSPSFVKMDSRSKSDEKGTTLLSSLPSLRLSETSREVTTDLFSLEIPDLDFASLPPLVILGSKTPTALQVKHYDRHRLTIVSPKDLWTQTDPERLPLTICDGKRRVEISLRRTTPRLESQPKFARVSPLAGEIGAELNVSGVGLSGGKFLLNGEEISSKEISEGTFALTFPKDILTPTRYNLTYEKRVAEELVRASPIQLSVDIPVDKLPHLVSVTFEPKRLKAGEWLTVTFTLRNNLPVPAKLTQRPAPIFAYDEGQSAQELGLTEETGALHLRITSDNTGKHNPGSWPYLFGFDRRTLAPGETIEVRGKIKMSYPGNREFRAGLVAGGFRFIDDNAFRTRIEVVK